MRTLLMVVGPKRTLVIFSGSKTLSFTRTSHELFNFRSTIAVANT